MTHISLPILPSVKDLTKIAEHKLPLAEYALDTASAAALPRDKHGLQRSVNLDWPPPELRMHAPYPVLELVSFSVADEPWPMSVQGRCALIVLGLILPECVTIFSSNAPSFLAQLGMIVPKIRGLMFIPVLNARTIYTVLDIVEPGTLEFAIPGLD
jgi:hypothetical protein